MLQNAKAALNGPFWENVDDQNAKRTVDNDSHFGEEQRLHLEQGQRPFVLYSGEEFSYILLAS